MTTTKVTYSCLPHLTPRARELQLSIEFWMKQYQEARVLSSAAWKMHIDAIDNGDDKQTIDQLYAHGCLAEDIAIDSWGKWNAAKAELLALYN
jgi:hypothetical protein